jgi:membrane carboxypeptidase/penicillin-binding protein
LNISESATIAALSTITIKSKSCKRPKKNNSKEETGFYQECFYLDYINQDQYEKAIISRLKIAKNINLYEVEANHIAELARQEIIKIWIKSIQRRLVCFYNHDSSSQNMQKKA